MRSKDFLLPAWARLLAAFENGMSVTATSKAYGGMYGEAARIVQACERRGWLSGEVRGREKVLSLTGEGLLVQAAVRVLVVMEQEARP